MVLFLLALLMTGRVEVPVPPEVWWPDGVEHDFGALPAGRPRTHVFRFVNQTSAPLTVETVRTTCGCTAARYTETPVAPGETGEITLEYDALKSGYFEKKARVFFYERKKSETLTIRGSVE
jgi:hypothetical protein